MIPWSHAYGVYVIGHYVDVFSWDHFSLWVVLTNASCYCCFSRGIYHENGVIFDIFHCCRVLTIAWNASLGSDWNARVWMATFVGMGIRENPAELMVPFPSRFVPEGWTS